LLKKERGGTRKIGACITAQRKKWCREDRGKRTIEGKILRNIANFARD